MAKTCKIELKLSEKDAWMLNASLRAYRLQMEKVNATPEIEASLRAVGKLGKKILKAMKEAGCTNLPELGIPIPKKRKKD